MFLLAFSRLIDQGLAIKSLTQKSSLTSARYPNPGRINNIAAHRSCEQDCSAPVLHIKNFFMGATLSRGDVLDWFSPITSTFSTTSGKVVCWICNLMPTLRNGIQGRTGRLFEQRKTFLVMKKIDDSYTTCNSRFQTGEAYVIHQCSV